MVREEQETVPSLPEIRRDLTSLHDQAAALMAEALQTPPTLKLLINRGPLRRMEDRLSRHVAEFVEFDANLLRHANPPRDINTALRNSAQFNFYVAVRDSVRGLLTEASAAVASIRSRLDFLGSLCISLFAIVVAVIALFV